MSKPHIPEPVFPMGLTEAAVYASCIEDLMNPNIDDAERAHLTAKAKALCGLTKQEFFAAKALQGICASGPNATWTNTRLAAEAFDLAGSMIAEGIHRA